jgi:hypothetical protein
MLPNDSPFKIYRLIQKKHTSTSRETILLIEQLNIFQDVLNEMKGFNKQKVKKKGIES